MLQSRNTMIMLRNRRVQPSRGGGNPDDPADASISWRWASKVRDTGLGIAPGEDVLVRDAFRKTQRISSARRMHPHTHLRGIFSTGMESSRCGERPRDADALRGNATSKMGSSPSRRWRMPSARGEDTGSQGGDRDASRSTCQSARNLYYVMYPDTTPVKQGVPGTSRDARLLPRLSHAASPGCVLPSRCIPPRTSRSLHLT